MHTHRRRRALTALASVLLVASVGLSATPADARPRAATVRVSDVTYSDVHADARTADVYAPASGNANGAAVLLVHGGGWTGGDKSDLEDQGRQLAAAGYLVVSVNYRLAPGEVYPAQLEDLVAALDWLASPVVAARYGVDAGRVGVVGVSAGGHLAALLGSVDDRVDAVVSWSGIYNVAEVDISTGLLGCEAVSCPERAAAASPITYVDADDAPMLLVSSVSDPIVSVDQVFEMATALTRVGAQSSTLIVEGDAHATMLPEQVSTATLAFLGTELGVGSAS